MWRKILPDPIAAALTSENLPQEARWLVGGAIRDYFLNRATLDFDFAVRAGARSFARRVGDRLEAAYFDLDKERDTGRVVAGHGGQSWRSLDFAGLRAGSIEEDLQLRDFTINAMALPLQDEAGLIDPTGGLADLKAGTLRLCRPDSLERDPIRALRAIRLSAELDFELAPELVKSILSVASSVREISIERLRDELFRIFAQDRPAKALRVANQLDLGSTLLPRLNMEQLRDGFARQDHLSRLIGAIVGEHRDEATADWVTGQSSVRMGRFRDRLQEAMAEELSGGRSRRQLLYWSALYIPEGFHESDVRKLMEDLRLSGAETAAVGSMARTWRKWGGDPLGAAGSRRSRYLFFKEAGKMGVELVLLGLIDRLAQQAGPPVQEAWEKQVERARSLLLALYEGPEEHIAPTPFLRGDELMERFQLQAGPRLGELLDGLKEEQAAGSIASREEALDWIADQLGWISE